VAVEGRRLRFAHTPDPDDAYMFYGLATGAVHVPGFTGVEHIVEDIETLNRRLVEEGWTVEVSAASAHAYAYIADRYYLMRSGASMGEGYGPVVVARHGIRDLWGRRVAVPGKYTTARLLLLLATRGGYREVYARFDRIPDLVLSGEVDAGLLIHEAQITYEQMGLRMVLSLWDWWRSSIGNLPMPLGVDLVYRGLGREAAEAVRRALQESIRYAWNHHRQALEYASQYARSGSPEQLDRFIRMYVNQRTLDMGEEGAKAHKILYEMAWERRLIPEPVEPEIV
jgi:1,4-dihydroxy-6-naphthoate synthase